MGQLNLIINMNNYKIGSIHILSHYDGTNETKFEWVGTGWSTPGTGYNTSDSRIRILGWKYVKPVDIIIDKD